MTTNRRIKILTIIGFLLTALILGFVFLVNILQSNGVFLPSIVGIIVGLLVALGGLATTTLAIRWGLHGTGKEE